MGQAIGHPMHGNLLGLPVRAKRLLMVFSSRSSDRLSHHHHIRIRNAAHTLRLPSTTESLPRGRSRAAPSVEQGPRDVDDCSLLDAADFAEINAGPFLSATIVAAKWRWLVAQLHFLAAIRQICRRHTNQTPSQPLHFYIIASSRFVERTLRHHVCL